MSAARAFQASGLLRAAAIAIAVAGVVDPAFTMSGATRARLAVVVEPPGSPAGEQMRARLVEDLGPSYEIVPRIVSDAAAAIVIGDRYPVEPVPDTLLVSTVTIAAGATPNVRIVRVEAPKEIPPGTTIHVNVDVEALGVAGRSTDLSVRIAGLEVGRASHRWSGGRERWRAGIDAVPIGGPPFALRVEATVVDGETTTADNVADTSVDARRSPLRILVYEPRPSWATTFVRRALEADARFAVGSLSFSSRGIAARTGDGVPLADPRLDEADVIIVGGLDRLSAGDVRSLDRFMRERGGAVALVPDARPTTGAVRDLLPIDMTERLLERPAKLSMASGVPSLEASELLVSEAAGDVIAKAAGADGASVVVSMPRGRGRLFVSGALDAWRYRANDDDAFDRFWRSAIAGLALAAPPPIDITIEPPLLSPLERADVIVRVRSPEDARLKGSRSIAASVDIAASGDIAASVDGDRPIRLRPEPEAGVFRGTFTARATPGRSTIEVRMEGAQRQSAARTVLVQGGVRRVAASPNGATLSMLASSHRGIDVSAERPGAIAELERFMLGAVGWPRATIVRRPMRSGWWLLPFAACLSAEWWLRRRRGLR